MKLQLMEFLSRFEGSLLLSTFAVGFGVTFLSLAVMISSANAEEAYCREFQTKVTFAGKEESAYATVCREADGAWKIQPNALTSTSKTVIVPMLLADETDVPDEEIIALESWSDNEDGVIILEEKDDGEITLLE